MKLKFSPCRMEERLEASVQGDRLTLNGVTLDLSPLPEGGRLPVAAVDNPWVASDVERLGGVIQLTLLVPHGADAPEETRYPSNFDTFLAVGDGPVPIPVYEVAHG